MALVKQTEYADRHGVSRKTVTKWKQDGHLVLQGNLVDAEASDERLRRAELGRFKPVGEAVTSAPEPNPKSNRYGNKGNSRPAGNSDHATVPEGMDGETIEGFLQAILEGRFKSKADATAIKENALAAINLLEMREKDGALIALERAEAVFFAQARANRDAWMNWPTDIGPRMAADLGLPADTVTEALTRYVHDHLNSLGDPDPDFAVTE